MARRDDPTLRLSGTLFTRGGPGGAIEEARRPPRGQKEYDLTGHYVLPGFVDAHVHLHTLSDGQGVPSDYVLKLWLAHGITTARNVGSSEMSIEQQVAN